MVDHTALGLRSTNVVEARIATPVIHAGLVAGAVRAQDALWVTTGDVGWITQETRETATDRASVDVLTGRVGSADVGLAWIVRWCWCCVIKNRTLDLKNIF